MTFIASFFSLFILNIAVLNVHPYIKISSSQLNVILIFAGINYISQFISLFFLTIKWLISSNNNEILYCTIVEQNTNRFIALQMQILNKSHFILCVVS